MATDQNSSALPEIKDDVTPIFAKAQVGMRVSGVKGKHLVVGSIVAVTQQGAFIQPDETEDASVFGATWPDVLAHVDGPSE